MRSPFAPILHRLHAESLAASNRFDHFTMLMATSEYNRVVGFAMLSQGMPEQGRETFERAREQAMQAMHHFSGWDEGRKDVEASRRWIQDDNILARMAKNAPNR